MLGGMRGCWGACVAAGGCAWLPGGHVWLPGGHVWLPGGACVAAGGVCMDAGAGGHAWMPGGVHGCRGACHVTRMPPPCGQTDTCKNITFANFVCGR